MIRLAINGYGRIGRSVLRALYESGLRRRLQVVAINELAELETLVHLTRYDTTHGRFPATVSADDNAMLINGEAIQISHCQADWPWAEQQIDVVLECSGVLSTHAELQQHLDAGADRVLLSQPGEPALQAIVPGVNLASLPRDARIVSAASCTSNCIVPVIATLDQAFSVVSGMVTTIHSAMNDQPVLDAFHHTDLRKTRAAGQSVIPVDTGLAAGIGRLLPALEGRFQAKALRVPTINVSAMELTLQVARPVTAEQVNAALRDAEAGALQGVLGITDEPLASCDFNHDPRSGIVDAGQTRVSGQLVSVLVWFDNEWAYANRMLEIVNYWLDEAR